MQVHIHIGAPKTGSTSIQTFLAANRATLAARGILYPVGLGPLSHVNCAVYIHEKVTGYVRTKAPEIGTAADLDSFRATQRRLLREEIAGCNAGTLIVSAESLFPHVSEARQVTSLLPLLGAGAGDVQVLAYLRRPDLFAAAVHAEGVRMGAAHGVERELRGERLATLLDYPARLRPWIEALGADRVTLKAYETERLEGGDVVTDFCTVIGLDHRDPDLVKPRAARHSLGAASVDHLRRFNAAVLKRIEEGRGEVTAGMFKSIRSRAELAAALEPFGGGAFRLNREQTRHILERHRGPAADLLRTFGQDDFDYSDLDREAEPPRLLNRDELADFAANLWLQNQELIRTLRDRLGEPPDEATPQHKTPLA
jgi:hypothetical protein